MAKEVVTPVYSLVIPIYNEQDNISQLHSEINQVMNTLKQSYEVIYINDGSTDNSLSELKKLKNIKIINLNRNYGQSTALDAGFKAAKGNIIISMDGDLQNDPKDIPRLLNKLNNENLDVVAGWRKHRKDNTSTKILTHIGRFLRSIIMRDPVHDTGCTLRVYKSKAAKSLDLQGEMHRYILPLLGWKGFKIGELEVSHRSRIHGISKYNSTKAIRGFIDLIYVSFIQKYSQRPLHIFGYLSIFSAFIGILSLAESIAARIIWQLSLNRNGYFYLGFFFLITSLLFFSFGIIIDLLIRIYHNTSLYEKKYNIKDVIET